MNTVGKRLQEVLRQMLYTQRRFSEETGIPESDLSKVMNDRNPGLSVAMKEKIANKFPNINLDWVELGPGHGEPLYKERQDTLQPSSRFWDDVFVNVLKVFAGNAVPPERAAAEASKYADAAVKVRSRSLPKV